MTTQSVGTATEDAPLLVTVSEAARVLGISRSAAYRCVASGELDSTRLAGRLYVLSSSIVAVSTPR